MQEIKAWEHIFKHLTARIELVFSQKILKIFIKLLQCSIENSQCCFIAKVNTQLYLNLSLKTSNKNRRKLIYHKVCLYSSENTTNPLNSNTGGCCPHRLWLICLQLYDLYMEVQASSAHKDNPIVVLLKNSLVPKADQPCQRCLTQISS